MSRFQFVYHYGWVAFVVASLITGKNRHVRSWPQNLLSWSRTWSGVMLCFTNMWLILQCLYLILSTSLKLQIDKDLYRSIHTLLCFTEVDFNRFKAVNIRRSRNHFIFNMEIPIPRKDSLYIETAPSCCPSLLVRPWHYPTLAHAFQNFRVFDQMWFGMLEPTATPTNLANQVKLGHAFNLLCSIQLHRSEWTHQNNKLSSWSSRTTWQLLM